MSVQPTDEQLRQSIEGIFIKYDTDKSGTLEGNEIVTLINDLFKNLGRNRSVRPEEVDKFIKVIDKNNDSRISKTELFDVLKTLIANANTFN